MIEIKGTPTYNHAFTAFVKFDFGTVELSAVFWGTTVYVKLPSDKPTLWKVVKVENELREFMFSLSEGITKMQFILDYSTQVTGGGEANKGFDFNIIETRLGDEASKPALQTASNHQLPFGSR